MNQSEFFCWMQSYGQEVAIDMARADGISEVIIYQWARRAIDEHDLSASQLSAEMHEFDYANA